MTIKAQKRSIRRATIDRVLSLEATARAVEEGRLLDQIAGLPGFDQAGTVLLYVTAFADEVDTMPLIRRCLVAGKRILCPRVDALNRRLELCELSDLDRELISGYQTIREPRWDCPTVEPGAVDWALIPGVAFDRQGYRLGRGGGYYDRLLPLLRAATPCWSLALAAQWVDAVPREPHDRPLSGVADQDRIYAGARIIGVNAG